MKDIDAEEIRRAIERLENSLTVWTQEGSDQMQEVSDLLAALIAQCITTTGDRREWCYLCGNVEHAPSCALLALVRAINGEQP